MFNATQYEFWVNAYAPNGSYVFTACIFVEDLNFVNGQFYLFGNQSEYSPFSLNRSGNYINFENEFDPIQENYDYYLYDADDAGNGGTFCVQILVYGNLEQNRTYMFELSSIIEIGSESEIRRFVPVIIRTKGECQVYTNKLCTL